jgi:hypothetical protein
MVQKLLYFLLKYSYIPPIFWIRPGWQPVYMGEYTNGVNGRIQ